MQFRTTKKLIIDEQKLSVLIRLGCPDDRLLSVIKTGKFEKTGDEIIDEILECFVDRKEFKNWGGNHNPKGINNCKKRKKRGQVDNQVDSQVDNQDGRQVVDKDIDIDKDKENIKYIVNMLCDFLSKKQNRVIDSRNWNKHIELLIKKDGISFERIKSSLSWYFEHYKEPYIPVIESASSLREKFSKLENAIERDKKYSIEKKSKAQLIEEHNLKHIEELFGGF